MESLSSYIQRLSAAHAVEIVTLVTSANTHQDAH